MSNIQGSLLTYTHINTRTCTRRNGLMHAYVYTPDDSGNGETPFCGGHLRPDESWIGGWQLVPGKESRALLAASCSVGIALLGSLLCPP